MHAMGACLRCRSRQGARADEDSRYDERRAACVRVSDGSDVREWRDGTALSALSRRSAHRKALDLPVMECIQLGLSEVQPLRDAYLRTLVAPMDGMWESTAIAGATVWAMRDAGRHAGYACIGADHTLLRVYLAADYQAQARDLFRWILSAHGIRRAIASTIEPPYLSLCLDAQRGLAIHSYLFRDGARAAPSPGLGDRAFRRAERDEFDAIARFYRAQTDGPGEWIGAFVRERLDRGELFGLYEGEAVVAAGECIPSRAQPPYADLGMVVARSHRGQGPGLRPARPPEGALLRGGVAAYLLLCRRQRRVQEGHRESRLHQRAPDAGDRVPRAGCHGTPGRPSSAGVTIPIQRGVRGGRPPMAADHPDRQAPRRLRLPAAAPRHPLPMQGPYTIYKGNCRRHRVGAEGLRTVDSGAVGIAAPVHQDRIHPGRSRSPGAARRAPGVACTRTGWPSLTVAGLRSSRPDGVGTGEARGTLSLRALPLPKARSCSRT